jgi:hypothetical protein
VKKRAVCVNMSEKLIWQLDQIRGFSRSGFIRYILELYFDGMIEYMNNSKSVIDYEKDYKKKGKNQYDRKQIYKRTNRPD